MAQLKDTWWKTYIQWIDYQFKSQDWYYSSYDKEAKQKIEDKTLTWIIVWQWFKFNTPLVATKKKWITKMSDEFWFKLYKKGRIWMRNFVRDWDIRKTEWLWNFTYEEIKNQKNNKLKKIIYLLWTDDNLYKIEFSVFLTNFLKFEKDIPDYLVEFWVSSEKKEFEFWEFYVPTITKISKHNKEDMEVQEIIDEIDSIINNTTREASTEQEQIETTDDNTDLEEDLPF